MHDPSPWSFSPFYPTCWTICLTLKEMELMASQNQVKYIAMYTHAPFSFLETSFMRTRSFFSRSLSSSVFLVASVSTLSNLLMVSDVSSFRRWIFVLIVSIFFYYLYDDAGESLCTCAAADARFQRLLPIPKLEWAWTFANFYLFNEKSRIYLSM